MVGRDITPTEVGKHANLIKGAQDEMATLDVLVCGRCLTVCHFAEEFKQHKMKICEKDKSNIRDTDDTKPKLWAFLLWKSTQLAKDTGPTYPSSWSFYQTWAKMDESVRETWIVAGKTIQSFSRVGQATMQEMPVKITKTVVNNSDAVSKRKLLAKANDSEGEKTVTKSGSVVQKIIRKTTTPTKLSPTISKPINVRRAKRSINGLDETVDDDVEKVVAKRFNPHRKSYEYLVKWEGRGHEANTWEPTSHLEGVPHFLEIFERQLARQKENRAMQAKQQQQAQTSASAIKDENVSNITITDSSSPNSDSTKLNATASSSETPTRPNRVSKTKAMDQVKQWVSGANDRTSPVSGNDSVDNGTVGNTTNIGIAGAKRRLNAIEANDSNRSDLPTTTSTMEDLEEDLIPSHTVKRMKIGSSVSVEVKTNTTKYNNSESKLVKMNGVVARNATTVSGESLPVGPNSADIILTQDTNATGVIKKPGVNNASMNSVKSEAQVHVLSKGEAAVSNSGIVRLSGLVENNSLEIRPVTGNRLQQLRSSSSTSATSSGITVTVGGASPNSSTAVGRSTPTSIGNTQITTIPQRQPPVRPPPGTTIQRKTATTPLPSQQQTQLQRTVLPTQSRTTIQTSPTSGRMIIPRSTNAATTSRTISNKHVTPEQKILQLSKSGDLKVTKKVMTREDPIAQRLNQRQQQQQPQVQIQKVQQASSVSRPSASVSIRKVADSTSHQEESQEKSSTHEEHQQHQNLVHQAGVLQTQLVAEQQLAQQEQQLQDIDPTLLLTADSQLLTNDDGTPLLVTGEDGTVYQVAGKNADGQTILVTTGPDGEQQFAYVATAEGDDQQMMALDNAVAEAVAQLPAEQQNEALAVATGDGQFLVKTTQEDGTTQMVTMTEAELAQHQALAAAAAQHQSLGQLCIQTGDGGDSQEANIPAEVVQADMPSPGGTRRVVLLLQDGTFMMTEMHDDEYKALNITT